jgi:hypothetical protein
MQNCSDSAETAPWPGLAAELNEFLSALDFRLRLFEDARRSLNVYLPQDFNVFEYIQPDENTFSRVLADLLSPEGPHGQDGIFLRKFLELIDHPELSREAGQAKVRCQDYCVREGGFIDITIELRDFGVGIENKPWAAEQKDQLQRYWHELHAKHAGRFCLVFLDGRGRPTESITEADRHALEAEKKFKMLSYVPDLKGWLESCAKESEADKVRWFLRDFAEYVERCLTPFEGEVL